MNDYEFRIIAAVLLISFVAHRAYYTRKVQHANDEVVEQPELGALSRIAGLLGIAAFLTTMIYMIVPAWISWSALPLPNWVR